MISAHWKPLTIQEVAVRIHVEQEFTPVEGNALESGDSALDRETEREILARFGQGDVWAWAAVSLSVSWGGFTATDYLGCCSYADEEDFRRPGGYYDDMVSNALAELNETMSRLCQKIEQRYLTV